MPSIEVITALREPGVVLMATATSLHEARAIQAAGIDAIVARGIQAGGHRGVLDPAAPDEALGTFALTRLLVLKTGLPVIAAGGIMDGAGIASALYLGAVVAQLGTAFIACPESAADDGYRAALTGPGAYHDPDVPHIGPTRSRARQPVHWTCGYDWRSSVSRLPHCV